MESSGGLFTWTSFVRSPWVGVADEAAGAAEPKSAILELVSGYLRGLLLVPRPVLPYGGGIVAIDGGCGLVWVSGVVLDEENLLKLRRDRSRCRREMREECFTSLHFDS